MALEKLERLHFCFSPAVTDKSIWIYKLNRESCANRNLVSQFANKIKVFLYTL